ncbi:MAG: thiamine phosphate synthase [Planctomycetota bacterium]|nr:thiamine phosphate synthase [Planctomycetota bacterium]
MSHRTNHEDPLPRVYLISGGRSETDGGEAFLEQLRHLPPARACMVQIREKQLGPEELLALARRASKAALPEGSLLLVNTHADIARAAGLHGVHLPESAYLPDLSPAFVPDLVTGCSAHSAGSARAAQEAGADFVLFGPVFDTPSKRPYGPPQGLDSLARVCRATSLPVFAVGGITPDNTPACLDAGAYGIAGISAFRDGAGLAETIERFYRALTR